MPESLRESIDDPDRGSDIDPATFRALEEMAGADFVDELVDTFLEEAPRMLAELRAGAERRDADRFRRAAHSLKSNALTFGALPLGAMAKAMEVGGLAGTTPTALDAIDAQYARTIDALAAMRRG